MRIFHGSRNIVEYPKYGQGKVYNDYGQGFYTTKFKELAKEWAVGSNTDGYVNEYELDIKDLKILDLRDPKYNILNWLALLVKNREFDIISDDGKLNKQYLLDNFLIDTKGYDIIKGYRADDSYFSFTKAFLNNGITIKKLKRVLYLGDLGEQIVLVSKKAFNNIKFIKSEKVKASDYFPLRSKRDYLAREKYLETLDDEKITNNYLFVDVIRGKWRNDDERLRQDLFR